MLFTDLHVVEYTNSTVLGLRSFTLPHVLTKAIITAVTEQETYSTDEIEYSNLFAQKLQKYMQFGPDELAKLIRMYQIG